MSVIIGIDPHKALHAACVIDRTEVELTSLQVRSGPRQLSQLLAWAAPFECRTWAIESAGGLGYLLAQQLVAHGEHVVDVPATLSARVRVLGSGRSNKNDANDARAVAIAALHSPLITAVRGEDHASVLRLLAKAQLDASRARSRACSRLHALVRELVAGGISKEIVVGQAEQVLASIEAVTATQRQRLELAHETLDEIRMLDAKLKRSKARITEAVTASGTTLTEIFGVGPIISALIIGYTGDIARFATAGPLRCVQRDGLDRVLLLRAQGAPAVTTRQPHAEPRRPHDRRHPDPSPRQRRPRLLRPQARRGPHSTHGDARIEAPHLRPRLHATESRRPAKVGPGGQTRDDSSIQRGRQTLEHRHFGSSHSRTQHQRYARASNHVTGSTHAPEQPSEDPDTKRDRYRRVPEAALECRTSAPFRVSRCCWLVLVSPR